MTTRATISSRLPMVFWGDKFLSDVKGSTCRGYLNFRSKLLGTSSTELRPPQKRFVKSSTARQELKTFQAVINHWHRESPLVAVPKVTLPEPGARRERVLERSEVARMLWASARTRHTINFTGRKHEHAD
jgi:hypothetical protein